MRRVLPEEYERPLEIDHRISTRCEPGGHSSDSALHRRPPTVVLAAVVLTADTHVIRFVCVFAQTLLGEERRGG